MSQQSLAFNTNRGYSAEGQPIECRVIGTSTCPVLDSPLLVVEFVDSARGISGVVEVDELTQEAVMRAYDAGHYTHRAA